MEYDYIMEMAVKEADEMLAHNHIWIRVVKDDGIPCICTRDYRLDRLNVEIENGVISKVCGVG